MRSKIILIFLLFIWLTLFTHNVQAYDASYPGSIINPLQVQIISDPGARLDDLQRQTQQQALFIQLQELRQQQLRQQLQYRLDANFQNNLVNYPAKQNTSAGSATVGNVLDGVCQQTSGINSYYSGETDPKKGGGMGGCSCKPGFQFEHGNYGQCVIKTQTFQPRDNQPVVPDTSSIISQPVPKFSFRSDRVKQITQREMSLVSLANLRNCPNETCESLGKYPEGTIIIVTQRYDDAFGWYNGTAPDGLNGWIYSDLLTNRIDNNRDTTPRVSASSSVEKNNISVSINSDNLVANVETVTQKSLWTIIKEWLGF